MQICNSVVAHERRVQLVELSPNRYRVTIAVWFAEQWEDISLRTDARLDFVTALRRFNAEATMLRQVGVE